MAVTLSLLLGAMALTSFLLFRISRRVWTRKARERDASVWPELATSLFESGTKDEQARLEAALATVAKRLHLRGALVTEHTGAGCRVLAIATSDYGLAAGLPRGACLPRSSLFCGAIEQEGQVLAVNYASLSEWRKHGAFRERGWESYIGLGCREAGGKRLVLGFFDTVPREHLFGSADRAFVAQLGPWIARLAALGAAPLARAQEEAVDGFAPPDAIDDELPILAVKKAASRVDVKMPRA